MSHVNVVGHIYQEPDINLDVLLDEWLYASTALVLCESKEHVVVDELLKIVTPKRTMSYMVRPINSD